MITISKEHHAKAQSLLTEAGFRQQHSRIFHLIATEAEFQYHCTVGFEDAEPDTYEVNISVLRRPLPKGKQGIRLEDVRIVPVDEAPPSMQEKVAQIEDQLEQL